MPINVDASDDEAPGDEPPPGQPAAASSSMGSPRPVATPPTVDKPKGKRAISQSAYASGRPQPKRGRNAEQPKAQSLHDDKAPLRLTADFASQLPLAARRKAHDVLESCWSTSKQAKQVIKSLVLGQASDTIEIHSPITTAVKGTPIGAGERCKLGELLPRLALLWAGSQVVAAAVYRNSHEERAEGDGPPQHRARRQPHRARTTEVLLFGVRDGWRRFGIGSALVAYVKHLAMVHCSTRLSTLFDPSTQVVQQFWSRNLEHESPAAGGKEGDQPCTSLFSLHKLRLGFAELGRETLEETLEALVESMAVATARCGCRQAMATQADGLEPDVLLGWFYKSDRSFDLAEYRHKEQLSRDITHYYTFFDEPPQTVSTRPEEPPRHKVWREAAAALEGLNGMAMCNWYFVVSAAPTEQPAFERQMAMQRHLPSQKDTPRQKDEHDRRASSSSSSDATRQPDTVEREHLSFFSMCAGTGMLPGVLANRGYKGIMVDDGRGGPGAVLPHNWYWEQRPAAGESDGDLERLSAANRARGIGEGDTHKRVRLWEMDTSNVDPKTLEPVTVALLDTQCTTRSRSSAAHHQRRGPDSPHLDNNHCGITEESRAADVEFASQIMLMQWLQYRYPDVLIIIENPDDGIEKHPLAKECVLAPREEGGLGLMCDRFTNCFFPSRRDGGKVFKKPEELLHNCEFTRLEFGNGELPRPQPRPALTTLSQQLLDLLCWSASQMPCTAAESTAATRSSAAAYCRGRSTTCSRARSAPPRRRSHSSSPQGSQGKSNAAWPSAWTVRARTASTPMSRTRT